MRADPCIQRVVLRLEFGVFESAFVFEQEVFYPNRPKHQGSDDGGVRGKQVRVLLLDKSEAEERCELVHQLEIADDYVTKRPVVE